MEKSQIKSRIILKLEEDIEQGNNTALQEFWNKIERNGAPLIEELTGDLENNLVTFIYRADEEVENVIFIPPIGWEKFLEYKMERLLNTNLWYITCKIKNDLRFDYTISVNDSLIDSDEGWEAREVNLTHDELNKNFLILCEEDGEEKKVSYVVMPKAQEHFWVKERINISKGDIEEYYFHSEKLEKDRRIRIYTPYGYKKSNMPYKFLILTDGDEYLNILSGKTVLDNLICDKKIAPIVVLFIDSTDTRYEELCCSDGFVDLIINELTPWFRENYNISSEAKDGIIGGLSLGGLTATYLGLRHSDIFGNVLSQSGAYWYKPEDFKEVESACWMSTEFNKIERLPLKFYLNVGILEPKDNMIGVNKKLRDVLELKGYEVKYEEFNSGHDYLCWGETLANGLISLIGDNN